MKTHPFVSCDWGTSSFRLRWIDPGLIVAKDYQSNAGCKRLFDRSVEDGKSRDALYENMLHHLLSEWSGLAAKSTAPIPLVISGMASSTIGWREIPYLGGSLKLDGSNLRFETVSWKAPPWLGKTYLISGVAIHPEIMRGEETEAIGILSAMPRERATLILPGTHSKHLGVSEGEVRSIATYMTGELFDVLSHHSLLKASVNLKGLADTPLSESALQTFDEGVRWGRERGLAQALFRVRTRAVLDQVSLRENIWFLSGLLIGAELASVVSGADSIILAGAGPLGDHYRRALDTLAPRRCRSVPAEVMHRAVATAHAIFLARQG